MFTTQYMNGDEYMNHENEMINKIAELNALFLSLNDKGQDSALNILRSLEFAQSVMCDHSGTFLEQNNFIHNTQ